MNKHIAKIKYTGYNFEAIKRLLPKVEMVEVRENGNAPYIVLPENLDGREQVCTCNSYIALCVKNGVYVIDNMNQHKIKLGSRIGS